MPFVPLCGATVEGLVTDEDTGLPVRGARISVAWPIKELEITTDAQGYFSYPGVLLGYNNTPIQRTMSVSSPGYFAAAAPVQLESCGETKRVEVALRLTPPRIFGGLEGHVRDAGDRGAAPGSTGLCPGLRAASRDDLHDRRRLGLLLAASRPVPALADRGSPRHAVADTLLCRSRRRVLLGTGRRRPRRRRDECARLQPAAPAVRASDRHGYGFRDGRADRRRARRRQSGRGGDRRTGPLLDRRHRPAVSERSLERDASVRGRRLLAAGAQRQPFKPTRPPTSTSRSCPSARTQRSAARW